MPVTAKACSGLALSATAWRASTFEVTDNNLLLIQGTDARVEKSRCTFIFIYVCFLFVKVFLPFQKAAIRLRGAHSAASHLHAFISKRRFELRYEASGRLQFCLLLSFR